MIDDFNRQSVYIEGDTSINSARLVRVFEQIKHDHRLPKGIRMDNGPEFLGEAFKQWSKDNGVDLQQTQAGKPNQNAFIGRFNRTFREDVRDQHLYSNLEEVRETTHWWMIDDNESRPHDALNDATPHEYRYQSAESSTFDLSAWRGSLRRRTMALTAVQLGKTNIRHACCTFGVSQRCYRYQPI